MSEKSLTATTTRMASSSVNWTPRFLRPAFTESMPLPLPITTLTRRLADHIPVEREKLGGVLHAAVLKPTGDDSGFDLEQRVANDRPVGGDRMARKLLHELREAVELVVLQASVDPIDGQQRHGSLFHRHVAGALAKPQYGRVDHFDAFGQRHNRVGHAHAEIHVEVSFEPLVDARLHRPHKILNGVRRKHTERIHQRQSVHVAFVRDAQ